MKTKHIMVGTLTGGLLVLAGTTLAALVYFYTYSQGQHNSLHFFDPISIAVSIYFGLMGSPLGLVGGAIGAAILVWRAGKKLNIPEATAENGQEQKEVGVRTAIVGGALGGMLGLVVASIYFWSAFATAQSYTYQQVEIPTLSVTLAPASSSPKISSAEEAIAEINNIKYSPYKISYLINGNSFNGAPYSFSSLDFKPAFISSTEHKIWIFTWCTKTPDILESNIENILVKFMINDEEVSSDKIATQYGRYSRPECYETFTILSEWPKGAHTLVLTVTFIAPINDGEKDYQAGDYVIERIINVLQ